MVTYARATLTISCFLLLILHTFPFITHRALETDYATLIYCRHRTRNAVCKYCIVLGAFRNGLLMFFCRMV